MPTTAIAEEARLLSTKLFAPTQGSAHLARSRLIARLDEGARQPLTLVTAPTGFGKTTLLAAWLSLREGPAGWVSLDRADNDPTIFWAYFITALRDLGPNVGDRPLSMLFSPEPPPLQTTLTALINQLATLGDDIVILLDDYHVVEDRRIHDGVEFFVNNIPPHVHLVIASRSQPPFPLARLRGQGRVVEVTPSDLRVNVGEATAFLNDLMGLDVPADAVGALERRTEGWIAGLQLAALSMQGREDIGSFVGSFSGDHRHIADVLVEEVLHRQTEEVQDFLLRTSILERMCGPLCDAVTGGRRSGAVLEDLERSHLFIVRLDERREWYRYHHLFADVLRARLIRDEPDLVRGLRVRAPVVRGERIDSGIGPSCPGIRRCRVCGGYGRAGLEGHGSAVSVADVARLGRIPSPGRAATQAGAESRLRLGTAGRRPIRRG
jgi:LuxR family maltose regulon positive regulatory protein